MPVSPEICLSSSNIKSQFLTIVQNTQPKCVKLKCIQHKTCLSIYFGCIHKHTIQMHMNKTVQNDTHMTFIVIVGVAKSKC